jgi:hypothetical protein
MYKAVILVWHDNTSKHHGIQVMSTRDTTNLGSYIIRESQNQTTTANMNVISLCKSRSLPSFHYK